MSSSNKFRAKAHRPPLIDATERLNHPRYSRSASSRNQPCGTNIDSSRPTIQSENVDDASEPPTKRESSMALKTHPNRLTNSPTNPKISTISRKHQPASPNRGSHVSTTSTIASDGMAKRKTHIGPWQLGKTLGKGSTARVRLARHAVTGQEAAVKIVTKEKSIANIGSLASLEKMDAALHDSGEFRRMPYGIEREVAIMKLIDHPHIMKLYDIWENRTEIYMVLEYIDNGDLFECILRRGRLDEEEAMVYFRQILSAVGYCHSFNICHRDLKPENILLNKEGQVKIADFGMAALHQTPQHRLQTPCGSPHYAAPELFARSFYRGDKADVWSIAVTLFAALSGRTPFDDANGNVQGLLTRIKSCNYEMSEYFSDEATDLIYRMLQLSPRHRLSIKEIWAHPLLRKYNYLDNYGGGVDLQLIRPSVRPVSRKSEIDRELLRHLQSMWHMFDESKIIRLLLNDESNDQKLFYSLMLKHREYQLENYVPEIAYSSSDYHHARSIRDIPRLSSRQFTQPKARGHGRQVSRFTVVSNVTKADTIKSYDPFKASRPQTLADTGGLVVANIVVHRGRSTIQDIKPSPRPSHDSSISSAMARNRQQALLPPKSFASRSSLASSTRSRASGRGVRVSLGNKRGVSFSQLRKASGTSQKEANGDNQVHPKSNRHSKFSEVTDDDGDSLRVINNTESTEYIRSKKTENSDSQPTFLPKRAERANKLWQEDVRQLSTSLAKDCDEAFNRTSAISTSSSRDDRNNYIRESPLSSAIRNEGCRDSVSFHNVSPIVAPKNHQKKSWTERPLPTPPSRSESINIELAEARRRAEFRRFSGNDDESPGYLDRMVSHIDKLIQPGTSPVRQYGDRRAASAPVKPRTVQELSRPLPAIFESPIKKVPIKTNSDYDNFMDRERIKHGENRVTSAPETRVQRSNYRDGRASRLDNYPRESIRVVLPSSSSPAKAPAPLNIRKQASQSPPLMTGALPPNQTPQDTFAAHFDLRQQYASLPVNNEPHQLLDLNENQDHCDDTSNTTTGRKMSNWFKRDSKSTDEKLSFNDNNDEYSQAYSNLQHAVQPVKKKNFGLGRLFGKHKHEGLMFVPRLGFVDESNIIADSTSEDRTLPEIGCATSYENPQTRQIEARQTWLAKLFHVKPAAKYICFASSNRRARQEITILLRSWKKYGATDIIVDKDRNIVFGRVAAQNYLHLREVSFASEIFTVIEHGKRGHLSIARFTQEKGAASSFNKVVETLENVLESRGILVSDYRKKKMMIKTLNS